jgi:long-chain acyl-CoA synthetase
MHAVPFISTPARFLATAQRLGDKPGYFVRGASQWESTSWKDYADEVNTLARALVASGVRAGQVVCILGFNRPEWVMMDIAAMMVGAVPAGIYWTSAAPEIEYILGHSQAPLLLVDTLERYQKVAAKIIDMPQLKHVVLMKGAAAGDGQATAWDAFLAKGTPEHQTQVDARLAAIRAEQTGTLIYTSGTTGPAKAVVLSHDNLSWTTDTLTREFAVTPDDRLISYLPLAHIAEQLGAVHNHANVGYPLYFARDMESLGEHLKEVHPTVFFGVPRVWEKMQAAIEIKLAAATGFKAKMAVWALRVGQAWHEETIAGKQPSAWLGMQMKLANKLIHHKVKTALGFDQARLLISGAAPIAPESLKFFTGLDIVVREVYGQSEDCGPTSMALGNNLRSGTVGKPFAGIDVRIAEDGEIMVRGPNVFQGYAQDLEATKSTLTPDGWLHSGDLGRFDKDGFLYVTGRKKDLLITSGGKNISPSNIEADLMNIPLVEHAVVVGDGRHFLAALLTLKPDVLAQFAKDHGIDNKPTLHPKVLESLQQSIDVVNERHARVANVRKFEVLNTPLAIETGELTPTMKIKRQVVIARNQAAMDAIYG